jgi:hypothetical protein
VTPVIAIATCKAFAERTLPRLCASLRRAGVNEYVIIGDNFSEVTEVAGELIHPAPVPGMWDLSPLPYVATMSHDWTFLIGDTCEVDTDFKGRIERWMGDDYDLVGLMPNFMQCFMGLYRKSYLQRNMPVLKRHAGLAKRDIAIYEVSADLIAYAESYRHAEGKVVQWDRQEDVYGVGRPRWHRYFGAFGVTKWTVAQHLGQIDEHRARIL